MSLPLRSLASSMLIHFVHRPIVPPRKRSGDAFHPRRLRLAMPRGHELARPLRARCHLGAARDAINPGVLVRWRAEQAAAVNQITTESRALLFLSDRRPLFFRRATSGRRSISRPPHQLPPSETGALFPYRVSAHNRLFRRAGPGST